MGGFSVMQLLTGIISGKQVMMLKTITFYYSQFNYLHFNRRDSHEMLWKYINKIKIGFYSKRLCFIRHWRSRVFATLCKWSLLPLYYQMIFRRIVSLLYLYIETFCCSHEWRTIIHIEETFFSYSNLLSGVNGTDTI